MERQKLNEEQSSTSDKAMDRIILLIDKLDTVRPVKVAQHRSENRSSIGPMSISVRKTSWTMTCNYVLHRPGIIVAKTNVNAVGRIS